jgi:hypothetical protein
MASFVAFTYKFHQDTGEVFDSFAYKIICLISDYRPVEFACYLCGLGLTSTCIWT